MTKPLSMPWAFLALVSILYVVSCKTLADPYQVFRGKGDPEKETWGSGPCHKASDLICAVEMEVHRLVNEYRAANGRSSLEHHYGISFVSRQWSREQARSGQEISHDGFPARRYAAYRTEFRKNRNIHLMAENVRYSPMNVADNQKPTVIAASIVDGWMKSPPHRSNMMRRDVTWQGTGVYIWNNQYIATQLLGRPSLR